MNHESSTATNLRVPVENTKGSQRRPDTQNNKQMALLEQEPEILREELQQVRAKLTVTTFLHLLHFPSFKSHVPDHFPSYTHSPPIPLANFGLPPINPANLPNLPGQTPYVPSYA